METITFDPKTGSRSYIFRISLLILLLTDFLSAFGIPREADRPNVVFILGDDMRLDHFGFIRGKVLTPHLDRLAAVGFHFSHTYMPSAACTPSRFSCLTGRFASRCNSPSFKNSHTPEGVYGVNWNTNLHYEPDYLPNRMKEAGYVTGIVGKWHNGSSEAFQNWKKALRENDDPSDPSVAAKIAQMDQAASEYLHGMGFDFAEGIVMGNYSDHPVEALRYHNQEVLTRHAVEFIRQNSNRPFFLYLPTTLMHGPSPWQSLNADPRKCFAGLLDQPVDIQPSRSDVIARARATGIPDYLIPATWLDDGIGVILDTLRSLGIDSSTMVIFVNDHGIEGGKGSCYEGGVRVSSMVYWPGRIEPGSSDALVANLDLYPTICEACGIGFDSSRHDGQSLWPLIRREKEALRDHIYCEWGYSRAIVTRDWKYLAFRLPPSKDLSYKQKVGKACRQAEQNELNGTDIPIIMPSVPIAHSGVHGGYGTEQTQAMVHYPHYYDTDQLYYLPEDPGEQENLAYLAGYHDILENMKLLLCHWVEELPGGFGEF